jgi:predicted Zn finger-like uncharacterized protein
MKFSCGRCKTRYSIADERVRGKILKIRCKNCQAVISVREGMAAAPSPAASRDSSKGLVGVGARSGGAAVAANAPVAAKARPRAKSVPPPHPHKPKEPQPSPLTNAFSAALQQDEPGASGSLSKAMPNLDPDWFVAADGQQSGPFPLEEARQWVADQQPGLELFCWTDGFDEWRNIDAVRQFNGARRSAVMFGDATVVDDRHPDNLPPMFARPANDLFSAAAERGPGRADAASDLDVEIGEVSRVVRLPTRPPTADGMGMPSPGLPGADALGSGTGPAPALGPGLNRTGGVPALGRTGGLPALGGTGGLPALGRTGGLPALGRTGGLPALSATGGVPIPEESWAKHHVVTIILGVGVLAAIATVLLYMAFGGDGEPEDDGIRRSRLSRANIGYEEERSRKVKESQPGTKTEDAKKTPPPPRKIKWGKGTNGAKTPTSSNGSKAKNSNDDIEEVDLGSGPEEVIKDSLDGEDLDRMVNKKNFPLKRCYETSLKKDPYLAVKSAKVWVKVGPEGNVTSVTIPGVGGPLLACLSKTVRSWRFPKSRSDFNGQFRVVFKNR